MCPLTAALRPLKHQATVHTSLWGRGSDGEGEKHRRGNRKSQRRGTDTDHAGSAACGLGTWGTRSFLSISPVCAARAAQSPLCWIWAQDRAPSTQGPTHPARGPSWRLSVRPASATREKEMLGGGKWALVPVGTLLPPALCPRVPTASALAWQPGPLPVAPAPSGPPEQEEGPS